LRKELFELVSEVPNDIQPYIGEFGRVSYFFMMLGGNVIPLF
jgi:hypothetical protein